MNNLTNNFIEYIGISKKIDDDYIISCEKSLEGYYDSNANNIYEILKVYINSSEIDYELIECFKATSIDGTKMEDYLCAICIKLNLTIEFIDNSDDQVLNVVSIERYFTISTFLPEDYLPGNELIITPYIDNLNIIKINESKIYYYIHALVTISSY